MAIIQVGDRLTVREINPQLSRAHSSGTGTITAASGGSGTIATFDTIDSFDPYIAWTGVNNTRMTFGIGGEYEYGFSMRSEHTAAATGGTVDPYILLNGTTILLADETIAVPATNVFYINVASDIRSFATNDYIECFVFHTTGVNLSEVAAGEDCQFWAKRTIGPT